MFLNFFVSSSEFVYARMLEILRADNGNSSNEKIFYFFNLSGTTLHHIV